MAMPAARAIRYKSVQRANPAHFGLSATIPIADSGTYTSTSFHFRTVCKS